MYADTSRLPADIGRYHRLHPMLAPFPVAFLVGTFATDLVYWRTGEIMWERFSVWLLAVGVIMAFLATIAGLVDSLRGDRTRRLKSTWFHVAGNILVLAVALLNLFVHGHDAYTAVVPWGVTLSGIVVAIMLLTGGMGTDVFSRRRVEIGQ
jgi:uncharacterized membrane protein